MQEWTVNSLSIELRRDRRTLTKIIAESGLKPVSEGKRSKYYHLADVVGALFGSDDLDLQQERAKLAQKQTEKAELQIAEMRTTLIDAEEVKETWTKYVMSCRAKLLSLPTKMASEVLTVDTLQEAQDVIKLHVNEALKELATD